LSTTKYAGLFPLVLLISRPLSGEQEIGENQVTNIIFILVDDLGSGDLCRYNPTSQIKFIT
jgi:hypothetical protein